jgi:hypothetical protein
MSRLSSLAIALVLGCYNANFASNVPCDPLAPECPNGEQCLPGGTGYTCGGGQQTSPDGRGVASDAYNPYGDDDGDGIINSLDNCPEVPNPGQENEDGDAWGDVCDLCPAYASTTQVDTDGDGVGDKCDPRPTTPGDKIVLFEGFHHGVPSGSGWTAFGTVTPDGDSVIAEDPGSGGFSALEWVYPGFDASGRETITTQLAIISAVANPEDPTIASVVDTGDPGPDSGIACEVGTDSSGSGFLDVYTLPNGPEIVYQAETVNLDDTRQLAITRIGQKYSCVDTTSAATGTASGDSTLTTTTPVIAISSQAASVRFDWVMIVQSN